ADRGSAAGRVRRARRSAYLRTCLIGYIAVKASTEVVMHVRRTYGRAGRRVPGAARGPAGRRRRPAQPVSQRGGGCPRRGARAGIVYSTAGQAGGYELTRPAGQISALEVVRAIDGGEPAYRCTEIRARSPSRPNDASGPARSP